MARDVGPPEVPSARKWPGAVAAQAARPRPASRHGRHARSADARASSRAPLSIRSAEGRRWSADLSGPGPAGLVIYGMGGIGKSAPGG